MASCKSCGSEVGCGCNLIDGLCTACYGKQDIHHSSVKTKMKKIVYPQSDPVQETGEFVNILNTKSISKEEKIRRINEILTKAQETYANQLRNTDHGSE
jgi:hypothetical protein